MKKLLAVLLATIMAFSFTACGGSKDAGKSDESGSTEAVSEGKDAKDLKIALILPGTVNDQGWNQGAYEGLEKIKEELGCQTAYSEKVAASDYEQTFRGYASQGFDMVIGHGTEFADAACKVAKDYEDVMFCITSCNVEQAPNVCSLENLNNEQGYLAGVVAALYTKTGVVGSIGGMEVPSIVYYCEGFKQGVAYVNEQKGKNVKALTAFTGDFDDASKVKESANAMINEGADVITHDADQAGLGIFEVVKEKEDVYAIGAVGDQASMAEGKVITSATNKIGDAIVLAAQYLSEGTLEAKSYQFGVKEGVIGLADFREFADQFSEEDMAFIEETKEKISSGEIEVKLKAEE